MFAWHDTPWMWVSMVVFWSLLAVLAYYVFQGLARRAPAPGGLRATEILDERYARGEISADEYRERRHTLESADARGSR